MSKKLGIDGLEKNIGEIPPDLSLILEISPGKIRENIKNQFVSQNLKEGSAAVVLLSRISPEDFLKDLRERGIDTRKYIEDEKLLIIDWYTHKRKRVLGIEEERGIIRSSRDILNVSISINKALEKLSEKDEKIAYVDVITEAINHFGWEKTKDYILDMIDKFKGNRFTTMYLVDEGLEKTNTISINSCIDGILNIITENNKTKLNFDSLDSKLINLKLVEVFVEGKRVKVKAEQDAKGGLSPTESIKNISNKIFGRYNKERGNEKSRLIDKKGLTNGRTNGLSNGEAEGRVNGRINGLTNGKTNGKVNGQINGLTNGKINGEVNGKINGLVNGLDKNNGDVVFKETATDGTIDTVLESQSIPDEDGLVDRIVGMTGEEDVYSDFIKDEEKNSLPAEDGLVNGLVGGGLPNDDEGFIKDTLASHRMDLGEGGSLPHRGMPPSWFKKGLGTVVIMIFLLTIPIMLNLLYVPVEIDVEIDGDFDDWHAVRAYYDPENDELEDKSLDIREYKLKESDGYMYLYLRTNGTLFEIDEGVHSVRFFIDVEDYGYEIGDIKADYLFEVYGWGENIEGTTLQRFNESRGSDDWNGFRNSGGGQAISEGSELEARFWIGSLAEDKQPSMVIHSKSPRGWDITAGKVWEGLDSIATSTELFGPKVVESGELEPLFSFESISISEDAIMESIVLEYNDYSSEYIDSVFIYDMQNYTNGEFIGEPIAVYENFENNATIELDLELTPKPREFIVAAYINDEATSREPIGLRLADILCRDGLSTIFPPLMENKHINEIPEEPRVDGAFAFWDEYAYRTDPLDDLTPHDTWNPNIDIRRHSMYSHDETLFKVGVEGNMMGGEDIPYHRSRPPELKDSDGDGIPDIYDPYPNDFTNDGTPDSEMFVEVDGELLPDVDGDGVADWPYGPDKWLNTTIPEDPKIPERYWGREVSRYIGPVTIPVRTGHDFMRIFIETDPTEGYSAPWLDIRADYMVNITGRNMEVTSAYLTEYEGSGNDWEWTMIDEIHTAINRTSLETAIDLELESEARVSFVSSDWTNAMDVTSPIDEESIRGINQRMNHFNDIEDGSNSYDLSSYNPETNSVDSEEIVGGEDQLLTESSENLRFYLREEDSLSLEEGNNELSVLLDNRGTDSHSWESEPFAGDLSITSDMTVHLYLEPDPTGRHAPGVNISLDSGGNTVGYSEISRVSDEGWYMVSIDPMVDTLSAGDTLSMNTEIFGDDGRLHLSVYYNNDEYDSRINIPTDTTVEVDDVRTYDSDGNQRSDFDYGEIVEVRTDVSHPVSADVIFDITMDVLDPDGEIFLENVEMDFLEDDDNHPPYSATYYTSFQIPEDVTRGKYEIDITALDIQGISDIGSGYFLLPKEYDVFVYPDNYKTVDADSSVEYGITVENIGNMDDIYELSVGESSRRWETGLYFGGELVALDEEGKGNWDWIDQSWDSTDSGYPDVSLEALDSIDFTLVKFVPPDIEGETDETALYATSSTEDDIIDDAAVTTRVPPPTVMRTLYLHEDDTLDNQIGDNTVQNRFQGDQTWYQSPELAGDFTLLGTSNVYLYIEPHRDGWRRPDVTVSLLESGERIGQHSIGSLEDEGWYEFPINTDWTLSEGNRLELEVSVSTNDLTLYYDSSEFDSRIELNTDTYIDLENIRTYKDGEQTDTFSAGDTVTVRADVSDPYGTQNIMEATLDIYNPDGELIGENIDMYPLDSLSSSEGTLTYEGEYDLDEEANVGEYQAEVTATDYEEAVSEDDGLFQIPADVEVDPDREGEGEAGTEVLYDHTITNLGRGNDRFELSVSSSQGFNLTLYDGDGNVIAIDYGGDGNWDYVDSEWDSTGSGNPDTGKLKMGESIDVTLGVEIPGNAESGVEDVSTLTATSTRDSSVSDTVTDVTTISEFSDIFIPVLSTIGLFVGMFIYRRKKEGNKSMQNNDTDSQHVYHNEDRLTEIYRGDTVG